MQQNRVERILKGRLRVTQSLLVAFLITGSILQAAPQKEEKEVLLFMNGMIQDSECRLQSYGTSQNQFRRIIYKRRGGSRL